MVCLLIWGQHSLSFNVTLARLLLACCLCRCLQKAEALLAAKCSSFFFLQVKPLSVINSHADQQFQGTEQLNSHPYIQYIHSQWHSVKNVLQWLSILTDLASMRKSECYRFNQLFCQHSHLILHSCFNSPSTHWQFTMSYSGQICQTACQILAGP